LIGNTTYTSAWVDWELRVSKEEGNKVFGVRLHSNVFTDPTPKALKDLNATVVDWDIDAIVRQIG
jgi:hypothetical protein